ncbi:hypothetical protein Fmac_024924 [Flemingia macrophylla]|uniref:G-patch domain-containing protein n=1 Tax=Flemingia macrophylla TaxID=520843 RepID=A0ABD1LQW4_9FABA
MERTPFIIKNTPTATPQDDHKPQPLVIHVNKEEGPVASLRILTPSPFPYASNKDVPLRYEMHTSLDEDISNIAGIGGMTRNGRVYSPKDMQDKAPREKEQKETEEKEKKSKDEADELLQFIRQSECSIVDQLNRTPAKITLLSLIMSSEPHRKALLKVLNEAYVSHSISQDKFEGIVGNIIANDHLTFIDEEIHLEESNHNKPLHISVKCKEYLISKVLVDNGSSLNVMPKRTLDQVMIKGIHMHPSNKIVQAFDGSKREVIGEVNLPIQVMDMTPAYSCLLGRPWIHDVKVVPSMFHQKVKFVVGDKLITVQAEDDMLISKPSTLPYVDATEEAIETSFQALEIANVEKHPRNMEKAVHIMTKNGYYLGQGLGKYSQGVSEPPIIKDNPRRQGLGYDPAKGQASSSKGKFLQFKKGEFQMSAAPVIIKCSLPAFDLCESNDC